jgi:hypothetical protein
MNNLANKIIQLLKTTFPTRVKFNDGSYIEFLNREAILYQEEDGHKMEIIWFFQKNCVKGRILRVSDINYWDHPHQAELISTEKKEEIQGKVIKYCSKRNIQLEIIRS